MAKKDDVKTTAAIPEKTKVDKPKKYKLKNPDTQYAESGFTLTGKQEKELPVNPSTQLLARIKSGFLEEVK